MPANGKPVASISLDLDNLWSYMKIHGDAGWEKFPSYLGTFMPRVLDILDRFDLRITFFVVGQDILQEENVEALRMIVARGHEIGNHSLNHEIWLHLYEKEKLRREIVFTEEQLCRITGQKPVGFRGPGFCWTPDLLEILSECGYLYDASTLPTSIGPLARVYYFFGSNLDKGEREKRIKGFGSVKDALRPVKPYQWVLASGDQLLEIPVTTIPFFKTPFHTSYLLYLSQFSEFLMTFYLKFAIGMCRMTSTQPSFLLHPLDLIGGEQCPMLKFFPGMNIDSSRKLEVFEYAIEELKKNFTLVNMSNHAQSILSQPDLKTIPVS